ncbi:MAG: hypothetical protein PHU49_09505 [Syntrophorhabdaceae bacterium]|nr:hypothetical protein [Syntrophorhabdaceae bacterium]MDD5244240.1 hypothetical protein [Syntrophorhabdaceae bacterium]
MTAEEREALEENIAAFLSAFDEHIRIIAGIQVNRNPKRYKKILYVTVLEAIAKVRYPSKGARDRFVKLVHNCGDWNDADRVSLPHLVAALERTSDPQFEPLRQFAYAGLRDWGSGGPVYLESDPDLPNIQSLWPKDNGGVLLANRDVHLELPQLRHVEMLYAYRNYLVHESRQPTAGFEEDDDIAPFYESVNMHPTVFGNRVSEWHLVYPAAFLEKLCNCCLSSLGEYLRANQRDPYLTLRDGWYLVEHLNNDGRFPVVSPFYRTP